MANFILSKMNAQQHIQKENNILIQTITNEVRIISICPMCGASVVINLSKDKFLQLIEIVMFNNISSKTLPFLSPAEREVLISGICESCFDKIFNENGNKSNTKML